MFMNILMCLFNITLKLDIHIQIYIIYMKNQADGLITCIQIENNNRKK